MAPVAIVEAVAVRPRPFGAILEGTTGAAFPAAGRLFATRTVLERRTILLPGATRPFIIPVGPGPLFMALVVPVMPGTFFSVTRAIVATGSGRPAPGIAVDAVIPP